METFHGANYLLLLKEYGEFLERDDVLMHVLAGLRRHLSLGGKAWADEAVKRGATPPLPEDPVACFAFRWDHMRVVKIEKVDLRYFVTCFYPGSHLNEKLMHWKRAIVHPFAEDMRRLGRVLLERLPREERIDLEGLVAGALADFGPHAFGPRAWTDADDEVPIPALPAPAAEPPVDDIDEAVAALARAVSEARDLSADERHDLALDARIVAVEARGARTPGRRERLLARLRAIAAHAPLADAAARVERHVGP
jgi:hypothetical protein